MFDPEISGEEALPFRHLLVPLVLHAREKLHSRIAPRLQKILTIEALSGWERYLLIRLSWVTAKAAFHQFQVYKTVRHAFSPYKDGRSSCENNRYLAFIGDQAGERLDKIVEEFPELTRLHTVLITQWVSAVREFLTRLDEDRQRLKDAFKLPGSGGSITEIRAGLSDPHRGGRCVVRLILDGATSLIYKPRSLAVEEHFSELLHWINAGQIPLPLKSAQCLNRGAYGWMEDVSTAECSDVSDVRAFYWRAGAMLCLFYLARGVDMHSENLIAAGDCPVLIDLEALWHPQAHVNNSSGDETAHSVTRTGFLPWEAFERDANYTASALQRTIERERIVTGWTNVNQDTMRWGNSNRRTQVADHLPKVNGRNYPASRFVKDVQAGFSWMGNNIVDNVSARRTFRGWLKTLVNSPRRRILRSSMFYLPILQRMTWPQYLRAPLPKSFWSEITTDGVPLAIEERNALEQLDIPYVAQPLLPVRLSEPRLPSKSALGNVVRVIASSLGKNALSA